MFPITGTALHVHHCQNPDAVGLFDVDHGIRKDVPEMTLGRRIKLTKAFRIATNILNDLLHLIVKTPGKFRVNLRIILRGLRVFLFRVGMKGVWFQRPTIL